MVFDEGGTIFISKEIHSGEQGAWSGQVPGYDNSVLPVGGESEETEFFSLGVPVQPAPTPSMSPAKPTKGQRDSSRRSSKKSIPGRKNNPLRVMLIILFIMVLLLLVAKEILLPKLRDMFPPYANACFEAVVSESAPTLTETAYDLPDQGGGKTDAV